MSTQQTEDVILSESDIEDIVREIEKAKEDAKQQAAELGHEFSGRCAILNGALSVILCRIDKRIGDAVWME